MPDTTGPSEHLHWVVRMNRRNRAVFFVLLGTCIGLHLHDIRAGAPAWVCLVLQFLVYPRLAYWVAARQPDHARQFAAEFRNVLMDGAGYGAWSAALGFPLWISFILLAAQVANATTFKGAKGLLPTLATWAGGVVLGLGLNQPFAWHLETSLHVVLACMLVLLAYLYVFGHASYARAISLHDSRRQMRRQWEEISALQVQLKELATHDPLTGLFNRRHLDEALSAALARCVREQQSLTVAMIDIDHFKQVNDRHGHPGGDALLRALAQLLQSGVRAGDLACRMGGEEFLLVLENAPLQGTVQRLQDLREAFAALQVEYEGRTMRATLSAGVASFPRHGKDPAQLLLAADKALYAAKESGRNRVCVAEQTA